MRIQLEGPTDTCLAGLVQLHGQVMAGRRWPNPIRLRLRMSKNREMQVDITKITLRSGAFQCISVIAWGNLSLVLTS
jgi:hypothetical protein